MLHFRCPRCKTTLGAPQSAAGQRTHCGVCGQRLQIPMPPPNKTILAPFVCIDPPAPPAPPTKEAITRKAAARTCIRSPAHPDVMNWAAILATTILSVMSLVALVALLPGRGQEEAAPQPGGAGDAHLPRRPLDLTPPPRQAAGEGDIPSQPDTAVARIVGDGSRPDKPIPGEPPPVTPRPRKPELAPDVFLPSEPPLAVAKAPVVAAEKAVTLPEPKSHPKKAVTPPRPPAVPDETALADAAFEKRLERSEDDLCEELARVPELCLVTDLELKAFREEQALSTATGNVAHTYNVRLHRELARRAVREGLPIRGGRASLLHPRAALIVQTVSKELRDKGFVSVPGGASRVAPSRSGVKAVAVTGTAGSSDESKIEAFRKWCDVNRVEKFGAALVTLLQMLQVEDVPTRLLLVREIGKARDTGAGAVLAERALVDPSREVRQAAIAALKKRPAGQYQGILMQGFSYPWPPVADHAAEALVALNARGAVPALVKVLDQPDPRKPFVDKRTGKRAVRELVRLNHMRNCFLCHAPSGNTGDLIRGAVPTPGQPLPRVYYQSATGDFARADTLFLRQDFSLNLTVDDPGPWPAEQRFDFVVRQRRLPPDKGIDAKKPDVKEPPDKGTTTYAQREAALYALRHLTGKNGGDSSKKWRELLFITTKGRAGGKVK